MSRRYALRTLLVVPLVLQMTATAGVISLVSYLNQQRQADQAATELQRRTSRQVADYLQTYLHTPQQVIRTMAEAVESGRINPADRAATTRFLWHLHRTFPDAPYLNFGLANGDFIGVGQADNADPRPYLEVAGANTIQHLDQLEIDSQGRPDRLKQHKPFSDFRGDGWYREPVQAGRAVWTTIYNWVDAPEVMAMGAGMPIVREGKLVGVAGVDVFLANISRYLQALPISRNGELFIVEPDGRLVADSSGQLPFSIVDGQGVRHRAMDSEEATIRDAARALVRRFGDFGSLDQPQQLKMPVGGSRDLVRVEPFRDREGLNWRIVVVIPEEDVNGAQRRDALINLLISLAAIGLSGGLALLIVRHINRQLNHLVDSANALAEGNLSQEIQPGSIQELAALATSFDAMTQRLRKSFATLRARNREMRRQIDSRTQELHDCRQQLDREKLHRRQAEEKLRLSQLDQQALPSGDRLTGLANRPGFSAQFRRIWQQQLQRNAPVSLLLIDIDQFQRINSHHGRATGDRCLIWIAELLRSALQQPEDLLARYGGEEFVLLLPNRDRQEAIAMAEQLQQRLRTTPFPQPGSAGSEPLTISVGIGIATETPSAQTSPEQLTARCEAALDRAKAEGPGRWCHFDGPAPGAGSPQPPP
jgi:diguanylate cyclase (GGDEF)-like protein